MGSLLIADAEIIKQIFVKDFASFPHRTEVVKTPKYFKLAMSSATGEHWKFLRSKISPSFSTGKLKSMAPLMDKCLAVFIACVEEKLKLTDTVDLHEAFGALTMDFTCMAFLGIDVNSQRNPDTTFVKYAKRAVNMFNGVSGLLLALFPDFTPIFQRLGVKFFDEDAIDFLAAGVREAMTSRRKEGGSEHKDVLQLMMNSQADLKEDRPAEQPKVRTITDDEVIANAATFLLDGYDSTASAITWITYCLATHREVQERLVDEVQEVVGSERPTYDSIRRMQYLDMVVSETLRLYPPTAINIRQAVQDVHICGLQIPSGMSITVPVYGLHRLEEYWRNPERFDPERFSPENKSTLNPYTYMPFGMGPRNCIAMRLALLETKMTIVTLLQHFRVRPSEKTDIPPKFSSSIFTKPDNGMLLKVEKRQM